MSTHNLCFEQKYEKYPIFFLSENFHFLVAKFSIYLNRYVFVMIRNKMTTFMLKISALFTVTAPNKILFSTKKY